MVLLASYLTFERRHFVILTQSYCGEPDGYIPDLGGGVDGDGQGVWLMSLKAEVQLQMSSRDG